ncbi:hypothetical protein [Chenggangzhangella methanolivorans]|uniref:Uncharacterized protein n=1 Tax=Chenggangzhangella methanolivorans TaxID=1437009 RepID=A0A9E6R8Y5_9HYPH|nr:hypothetical protein [Chenggangzhangella methanolivorans]QZO00398.1 hypothetical protein K6K41_01110 [Chenggangzhangella methanolivorans]
MDRDEIASSQFYQDFLAGHGIGAFAGVGFRAGGDLWCLSVSAGCATARSSRASWTRS